MPVRPPIRAGGLALCLAAGAAFAQFPGFVSEQPSPLRTTGEVVDANVSVFSGTARISGRFEARWAEGIEDGDPGDLIVSLHPDRASQALLPHPEGEPPVRQVWLTNTAGALDALLTPKQRRALSSRAADSVQGTATIEIADYRTSVDCDQRGYSARLRSVVRRGR